MSLQVSSSRRKRGIGASRNVILCAVLGLESKACKRLRDVGQHSTRIFLNTEILPFEVNTARYIIGPSVSEIPIFHDDMTLLLLLGVNPCSLTEKAAMELGAQVSVGGRRELVPSRPVNGLRF